MCNFAQKNGLKGVISPIFYHSTEVVQKELGSLHGILDKLSTYYRKLLRLRGFTYFDPLRHLQGLYDQCDLVLPNTANEMEELMNFFSIEEDKIVMIPNGVESRFKYGRKELFVDRHFMDDFILFVGRIEPRKNIFNLIDAFSKTGLDTKLVIIGKIADASYYDRCVSIASKNVIFLPPIQHGSQLLESAYKAARVVVLPSYYETPGISALEGGLAGANIAVTRIGGTTEYFQNYAHYLDPYNIETISASLVDAYTAPKSLRLSEHIETNYTWDKIGKATEEAYSRLFLADHT